MNKRLLFYLFHLPLITTDFIFVHSTTDKEMQLSLVLNARVKSNDRHHNDAGINWTLNWIWPAFQKFSVLSRKFISSYFSVVFPNLVNVGLTVMLYQIFCLFQRNCIHKTVEGSLKALINHLASDHHLLVLKWKYVDTKWAHFWWSLGQVNILHSSQFQRHGVCSVPL